MSFKISVLETLLIAYVCTVLVKGQLPLPSYIKQCSKSAPDFEECCLEHAIEALPSIIKGDKEYGIPPLNPLVISSVELDTGGFKISFKDLKLYGLDKAKLKKVKFDLENKALDIEGYFDKVELIGKYKCSGKILVMPIEGEGNVNVTIVQLDLRYHVNYMIETINGENYIVFPEEASVDYTLGRAYYNLEDLFGKENGELGKVTLTAINEDWDKVMDILKPIISKTIISVGQGTAGQVAAKVPAKYVFLD